MAKPRVFVSSTYYDLKHIRNNLESFIDSMGFEPVLFESGDIPFHHDVPLDHSCYAEIRSSHMFVLIVGNRYGSMVSGEKRAKTSELNEIEKMYEFYNSITSTEHKAAADSDLPTFIFVEKNVLAEYETYKANKERKDIKYAHVDNIGIFRLLDGIFSQERNNLVRGFEKVEEISFWLREQWAGLFCDFLKNRRNETLLKDLAGQINEMKAISDALRTYSEALIKQLVPDNANKIISDADNLVIQKTILRFSKEVLIDFLLGSEEGLNPELLYKLFEESKDYVDFIEKLNLSPSLNSFLLGYDEAQRDYEVIAMRFFDRKVKKNIETRMSEDAKLIKKTTSKPVHPNRDKRSGKNTSKIS